MKVLACLLFVLLCAGLISTIKINADQIDRFDFIAYFNQQVQKGVR
jgi:hypothetical protein